MRPYELVSDEGLELLEHNADTILEEVGVEIRDYPAAIERFRDAGADVDGTRVRFPRGMCRQLVQATAPAIYTQHARNPERNVQIGGDATVFAPNYGSPFVHDLDHGRRYATLADFENFVKLAYCRRTCTTRAARCASRSTCRSASATSTWCTPTCAGATSRSWARSRRFERAADSVEMARIAFGGDLADRTVMTSLINASSPLVWDATMLAAAEVYAAGEPGLHHHAVHPRRARWHPSPRPASSRRRSPRRWPAWPSPSWSARARPSCSDRSPARCRCRAVRPRSAPRAGDRALHGGGAGPAARGAVPLRRVAHRVQAARRPGRLRVAATLLPTVMAGVNFVLHAAGWLEGGLAIGYEKFVLDCDQLGMMATFVKGLDLSENGQALDAIREKRPGSTSSAPRTRSPTSRRRSTAPHGRQLSFEQWSEEGGLDAAQRANAVWKEQLAAYEAPPIDDAIDAELRDFVERRKAELPDEFT
jgi:trimethylamine---corrinoid protein Co-methyltransferase